jgi:hypothetical protein
MRSLILSALLLASAFQAAFGEIVAGQWTYFVENGGATITASTATGAVTIPSILGGYAVKKVGNYTATPIFGDRNTSVTSVVIPNSVTSIWSYAFYGCTSLTSITIPNSVTSIGETALGLCPLISITIPNSVTSIGGGAFYGCTSLTSITIPNSVTSIGPGAFFGCTSLTRITMPDKFITQVGQFVSGELATDYLINALANNDAFVTAVANKIKATGGNYGIATQSGLSSAIEPLATKTQITTAINEGKASGIASVTASPNTWSLFTTSQIQNMAIGDLVLTREVNGNFVLNYDIEQSTDLQTWTPYQALSLPLTGLPTDKAFVRIKAKQ